MAAATRLADIGSQTAVLQPAAYTGGQDYFGSTDHIMACGTFVTPGYYSTHLGGSSVNWPQANVPGDNRRYLAFWGQGNSVPESGCCHTELSDNGGGWNQPFDVYVRE